MRLPVGFRRSRQNAETDGTLGGRRTFRRHALSPAIQHLATEALSLEEESRAELASILLRSPDEPSADDPEIERGWLVEADRRDRELASGAVQGQPWDEVLAAARDRLR